MNSKELKYNIKDLIILYFEGRSTPEQEKLIYDYFSNHKKEDLSEEMEDYYFFFSLFPYLMMEPPAVLVEKIEKSVNSQKKVSFTRREKWLTWLSTIAAVFLAILLIYPFCKPEWQDIENTVPIMYLNIKIPEELISIGAEIINEKSPNSNIQQRMVLKKKADNNISKKIEKQEKSLGENCNYPYYEITDIEEASQFLKKNQLQFTTIFSKSVEARDKIRDIGIHISQVKSNN